MKFLTSDYTLLQELSVLKLIKTEPPVISFDALKKQFVYTFVGNNKTDNFVIELRIKKTDLYALEDIKVYTSTPIAVSINGNTAPIVSLSNIEPFFIEDSESTLTTPSLNSMYDIYTSFLLATSNLPNTTDTSHNTFVLNTLPI